MNNIVRIGTRNSNLALWQAKKVQKLLLKINQKSAIIPVKTDGDIDLSSPIHKMGITGVFTKSLDVALLENKIDIAIHSMKDVPTSLTSGLIQSAVLKRDSTLDIILSKNENKKFKENKSIVTGSLRRKAQWLSKFPNHNIYPIRGNIETRIEKFEKSKWDGIIFSKAAIDRLSIKKYKTLTLDWMIPAPAQGAIVIINRSNDKKITKEIKELNDSKTEICTQIERDFLKTLEGGCSAPIGALAEFQGDLINFLGGVFSLNGKNKKLISKSFDKKKYKNAGKEMACKLLKLGADRILNEIKI